jgi:hypothetical protein
VPEFFVDGIEGFGSRFHVLRARTRIRWYQWHQVSFLCFAHPDTFLAVPRASGPVFMFGLLGIFSVVPRASGLDFMFCTPGHIFGGTEVVDSRFNVLRAQIHFRLFRGRRVLFSCFARSDSFSTVPRASGPVFMF